MTRIVPRGTFTAMQPLVVKKNKESHVPQKGGLPPVIRTSSQILADMTGEGWRPKREYDDAKPKGKGWNTECHRGFYEGNVKSYAF